MLVEFSEWKKKLLENIWHLHLERNSKINGMDAYELRVE
jgi:hypothetical protein